MLARVQRAQRKLFPDSFLTTIKQVGPVFSNLSYMRVSRRSVPRRRKLPRKRKNEGTGLAGPGTGLETGDLLGCWSVGMCGIITYSLNSKVLSGCNLYTEDPVLTPESRGLVRLFLTSPESPLALRFPETIDFLCLSCVLDLYHYPGVIASRCLSSSPAQFLWKRKEPSVIGQMLDCWTAIVAGKKALGSGSNVVRF